MFTFNKAEGLDDESILRATLKCRFFDRYDQIAEKKLKKDPDNAYALFAKACFNIKQSKLTAAIVLWRECLPLIVDTKEAQSAYQTAKILIKRYVSDEFEKGHDEYEAPVMLIEDFQQIAISCRACDKDELSITLSILDMHEDYSNRSSKGVVLLRISNSQIQYFVGIVGMIASIPFQRDLCSKSFFFHFMNNGRYVVRTKGNQFESILFRRTSVFIALHEELKELAETIAPEKMESIERLWYTELGPYPYAEKLKTIFEKVLEVPGNSLTADQLHDIMQEDYDEYIQILTNPEDYL